MADGIKKPKIHVHEETGMSYLKGAKHVLFETGVLMPKESFEEDSGKNIKVHHDMIRDSSSSACNYDFGYAKNTGILRKKRGFAKKETAPTPTFQIADVPEPQTAGSVFGHFSSVFIVTLIMGMIGVGSAIMSAYHTSLFFVQGGKPVWTGVFTGIMFVLFSCTAFTMVRYFIRNNKAVAALFLVTGCLIIIFSIFSTLAVNFNQFKRVADEKISVVVRDDETLMAHENLMIGNTEQLEEVNNFISRLESEMEYWRGMSWRRYDDMQTQYNQAQALRNSLRQEQRELQAAMPDVMAKAEGSQQTVYTMVSKLFRISEDVLRFFVYVAPACLYDILAPFALSVVLLLTDKRRRYVQEVTG